jgi:hypothetical protein
MADTSNETPPSEVDFNTMSPEEFSKFDLDSYLESIPDTSSADVGDTENSDETENTVTDEDISGIEETTDNTDEEDTPTIDKESNNTEVDTALEFYNTIIGKPIKANGHEIVFDDPAKVIQAVQMGVNYTKRMQELKPYQGAIKALKDAELLKDERKLAQLMDIAYLN